MADDSNQLKALAVATPASIEDQRLQLALVYRLAHKRILARHLRRVLFALDMLRAPTVPRSKGEWLAALTRAAGSLDNQGFVLAFRKPLAAGRFYIDAHMLSTQLATREC